MEPPRPPIEDVIAELEEKLLPGDFYRVTKSDDGALVIVDATSFAAAVLIDREYAYSGLKGYGVVTEIGSNVSGLSERNSEVLVQNMLMELHPEGVLAWQRDPESIILEEFHRAKPPSFKVTFELRAFLASDDFRLKGWEPKRRIYFQIEDTAAYRRYIQFPPPLEEMVAYEQLEGWDGLHPEGHQVVQKNFAVWRSLEDRFVKSGKAVLERQAQRNGSGTEVNVALSFPNLSSFQEFLAQPGVAFASANVPDPLDPSADDD